MKHFHSRYNNKCRLSKVSKTIIDVENGALEKHCIELANKYYYDMCNQPRTIYIFKQKLLKLASALGLGIVLAHYPPYCSKYNPTGHRGCLLT